MLMSRHVYTQCYACTDPVVGGTIDHEAEPLIRQDDLHFHLCDPCAMSLLGIWGGEAPPSRPHALPSQQGFDLDGAIAPQDYALLSL